MASPKTNEVALQKGLAPEATPEQKAEAAFALEFLNNRANSDPTAGSAGRMTEKKNKTAIASAKSQLASVPNPGETITGLLADPAVKSLYDKKMSEAKEAGSFFNTTLAPLAKSAAMYGAGILGTQALTALASNAGMTGASGSGTAGTQGLGTVAGQTMSVAPGANPGSVATLNNAVANSSGYSLAPGASTGMGVSNLGANFASTAATIGSGVPGGTSTPSPQAGPGTTPPAANPSLLNQATGLYNTVDQFITDLPGTKDQVLGAIGVGSGVYDLATGRPDAVAQAADPFSTQRGRYATDLSNFSNDPNSNKFFSDLTARVNAPAAQASAGSSNYSVSDFTGGLATGNFITQLSDLMKDPSSVMKLPGFEFLQKQGIQGVERTLAAQGRTVSGNEMLALQEQSQGLANQQYMQQLGILSPLAQAQSAEQQNIWSATNQIGSNQAMNNANLANQTAISNAAAKQQQEQFAADLLARQYNQQQQTLGGFAGAGFNPATGAAAGETAKDDAWTAINQGVGALASSPGQQTIANPSAWGIDLPSASKASSGERALASSPGQQTIANPSLPDAVPGAIGVGSGLYGPATGSPRSVARTAI